MEEGRWLLAFQYRAMQVAGEAYELCRDLIFGLDIDASVYRIQVNTVPYVVVLGEGQLFTPVREMFERSCTRGQTAELSTDVIRALFDRRARGKIPGAFWERRSRQP